MGTTSRRAATGLLLALVASVGLASPALADHTPTTPTPSPSSDVPTSTSGDESDSGSTVEADKGGCHLVSTPQSLGSYCPGSETDTKSIKQILGSEKFVKCWDDPMTADEQATTGYYDSPPGAVPQYWAYYERCLMGIDENSLAVTPPIYLKQSPKYVYDLKTVRTIGPHERQLLVFTQHAIPYPIAVVSPTTQPRVGQWLSFFDGQTQKDIDGTTEHQVTVNALGSTLVAKETQIRVQPRGAGVADSVTCPDSGHKADVGEKPVAGGSCWYRYPTSSAGQPNEMFPVRITATWQVTVDGAPFNTFTKSVTTNIPVTEIQAINVPVDPS